MIRYARMYLCILCISSSIHIHAQVLTEDSAQADLHITIELREIESMGVEGAGELYQWAGVCTDESCNVYVTDMIDYSIKKYSATGLFIKKTEQRQTGPAEFMSLRIIGFHENRLYVTDQFNPGIEVFNRDLAYLTRIPYDKPVVDLEILRKNEIGVTTLSTTRPGAVEIIDSLGQVQKTIPYPRSEPNPLMNVASFEMDDEKHLYICFKFRDEVIKTDFKGNEIWTAHFYQNQKPETTHILGLTLPKKPVYKDIALDRCGHIFILAGRLATHKSRDVLILNKDGKQLSTVTLPETSHCIHIDDRNALYSRGENGSVLRKYEINYR